MSAREAEPSKPREKPVIDVSASIGEAGHEVEEQGFEGVPDEGPLLKNAGEKEHRLEVGDVIEAVVDVCPPD